MASLGPRPFIVVPSRFTHSRVCGAWPCQLQELRDVTIKDAIAQLGETKHQEEGGKKEESELPATSVERRPTGSDLRFVLLEEPQALRKMMKTVRVLLTFKVERALPAPLVCPGVDTSLIVRAPQILVSPLGQTFSPEMSLVELARNFGLQYTYELRSVCSCRAPAAFQPLLPSPLMPAGCVPFLPRLRGNEPCQDSVSQHARGVSGRDGGL